MNYLNEMIYKRKSTRSYIAKKVDDVTIEKIKEFIANLKPLYPQIKVEAEIVEKKDVKCLAPWLPFQMLSISSEEKEGYLENVGFMFQQLDLYLHTLGLGVCWLGMGKPGYDILPKEGMTFVIMIVFGYPQGELYRKELSDFYRKALHEISDTADMRLEPARLAPSSVNSQPWYFIHDGDVIHTYCSCRGLLKTKFFSDMNTIDIGICLSHIYLTYKDSFNFFRSDNAGELKDYRYIGSFTV